MIVIIELIMFYLEDIGNVFSGEFIVEVGGGFADDDIDDIA